MTSTMSTIELRHPHTLSPEQARAATQHIADALGAKFAVDCGWQGEDCLTFKRAGVNGAITLAPGQVQISAKLSFPLSLMKAQIEAEICRVLQEKFQSLTRATD